MHQNQWLAAIEELEKDGLEDPAKHLGTLNQLSQQANTVPETKRPEESQAAPAPEAPDKKHSSAQD